MSLYHSYLFRRSAAIGDHVITSCFGRRRLAPRRKMVTSSSCVRLHDQSSAACHYDEGNGVAIAKSLKTCAAALDIVIAM